MNFSSKFIDFFNMLSQNCDSVQSYESSLRSAFSLIADETALAKAEISVKVPESRICRSGADRRMTLFESAAECKGEPLGFDFTIIETGSMSVRFYCANEDGFSQESAFAFTMAGHNISTQYDRILLKQLADHVIKTDLETGAATLDALMQYAGMLIAKDQLKLYSIIFFNIHNFKYVNKVLSYDQGDVVLRNYTKSIIDQLAEGEFIARLGGDNFVMLVRNERLGEYIEFLNSVTIAHETPNGAKHFNFSATIGYSNAQRIEYPRDVMARVSLAYAAARRLGAGRVVEYSDDIKQQHMKAQSVLSNFKEALKNREFVVYYQPKVNIKSKKIFGAEALVRWFRDGKLVPPMEFVPLLERDGSIIKLDYYVLEEVCGWLKARIAAGKEPLRISVNFSRKHLEEDDLAENIVRTIDKYGIDHKYIEIELTESDDYQNFELITDIVNELSLNGIVTSMDDFGTGFSSLNMIKNVDLHVIKIDRSFIPYQDGSSDNEKDRMMFSHIISMINDLGKESIAEGVETEDQLEYLASVGCNAVQGFVFDKPLPCEQFEERLVRGYN